MKPRGGEVHVAAKRQRRVVGSILKIALDDVHHSYAQVLKEPELAFFDIQETADAPLETVLARPVIFRIAVMRHAITSGRWARVGKAELSPKLSGPQPKFIQDPLDPSRFEIYLDGLTRPATRDECVGLERAAVWDPSHVEDRLRDYFGGRPNKWVESLKIK